MGRPLAALLYAGPTMDETGSDPQPPEPGATEPGATEPGATEPGATEPGTAVLGARRGMSFADRFHARDSYGVLLVFVVSSLVLAAGSGGSGWMRLVAVSALGGTLGYALYTSRAGRTAGRIATAGIPICIALGAAAGPGNSRAAEVATGVAAVALALAAAIAVVRRVGAHPRVDAATILGALCTYLLIGTVFAFVFWTIGAARTAPFFAQGSSERLVDFLYFSFVTLSTVGYGDLTAAGDLSRMLAVTEGLIGQLYLVTVVALVISNIGRERRRRA